MVRATERGGRPGTAAPRGASRGAVRLEQAALALLLGVLALRPLLQESHSAERVGITAGLDAALSDGPIPTLVLDTVIALALLFGGAAAVLRRTRIRLTVPDALLVLVAAGCLVSCTVASNKRLALTAASDFALLLMMGVALQRLVVQPWQSRLVLAIVGASAAAFALECHLQRTRDFAETIRQYEAHRAEWWARQGVPLDAPEVQLFERRLYAREVSGYFAHSNDAGGYLVMGALAVVGVAVSTWRAGGEGLPKAAAVAGVLVALWISYPVPFTGSKSALGAGLCGLAFVGLVSWLRRTRWYSPRRAWIAGWAGAGVAVAAIVGHGLYRGGLPGASLDFRWDYWSASVRMIAAQPWRGVGMANFGRHYPQYKTPQDVEDVSDPHNPLVRAAAEWGLPAAVLFVLALMSASWAMADPCRPLEGQASRANATIARTVWVIGFGLAVLIALARPALIGAQSSAYAIVAGVTPALVWLPAFAVLCAGGRGFGSAGDCEPSGARVWIGAAALAFLLHSMVSGTMFTAGAMTPLVALYAVGCADGGRDETPKAAPARFYAAIPAGALFMLLLVAVAAFSVWQLVPAWRSTALLHAARRIEQLDGPPAGRIQAAYEAASAADAWDPTAPDEMAQWLASTVHPSQQADAAGERAEQAVQAAKLALQRDPHRSVLHRQLARLQFLQWQVSGEPAALRAAVDCMRQAAVLSPSRPETYADLGDLLVKAADAATTSGAAAGGDAAELLREAQEALERAIALDAARPAAEEIRRLSQSQLTQIEQQLIHIKATIDTGL